MINCIFNIKLIYNMGWFSCSKKEQLVDDIAKSKIKKKVFIEFLENEGGLLLKTSDSWDKIIKGVDKSKLTEGKLKKFIISQRKKSRKKSAKKKVERETALKEDKTRKGSLFEKKVASWLKKKYKGKSNLNVLMNGKVAVRAYEIDIHFEKKFRLGQQDVCVECKNRGSSIKRTDIHKLITTVEDINKARSGGSWYFDKMLFVSMSKFDTDALAVAKEKRVGCVLYEDGKFKILNDVL